MFLINKYIINGMGIMGRIIYRLISKEKNLEVVQVNDIVPKKELEHLIEYDSVHGREKGLNLDAVEVTQEMAVKNINWEKTNVDVVIDSTPHLKTYEQLNEHIEQNAKYVVRCSPFKRNHENMQTIVLGVNNNEMDLDKYKIISMASCTTNCLAQLVEVVTNYCKNSANKILSMEFLTVHAITSDQLTRDGYHKSDTMRGRDASNIIPASTGASSQIILLFPELKGKIHGRAYRVPVQDGSVLDLVVETEKEISYKDLNDFFKKASEKEKFAGILSYEKGPFVSSDCIDDLHTCIYSENLADQINPNKIIIGAFYDNEFGYSTKIVELVKKIQEKKFK